MDKTNLNNGHWQAEDYTQRMTNAEWQNILLNGYEGKKPEDRDNEVFGPELAGDK